jgi:hypothetical protein
VAPIGIQVEDDGEQLDDDHRTPSVLKRLGPAFTISNINRAGGGVLKTVDGQGLAAFDLQTGLERQVYEQWHDVLGTSDGVARASDP